MESHDAPGFKTTLFLGFVAAYLIVEAYNAGRQDAQRLAKSEDPSADEGKTGSPSNSSQPEKGE